MRASYVDTLMARLSGEVAPIWVSFFLELNEAPPIEGLRAALAALVAETPRLRLAWREPAGDWFPTARGPDDIDAALRVLTEARPESSWIAEMIKSPIDLGHELPLRLWIAPRAEGGHLLAVQLHHATGDARSLGALLLRLWSHLRGEAHPSGALSQELPDRALLRLALARPWVAARLWSSEHRMMSRRGLSLQREADFVGDPALVSVRFSSLGGRKASDLFFASLLAAVALSQDETEGIVRLRVPIDLRESLGVTRGLVNGCTAIPVEVSFVEARRALHKPEALAALVHEPVRRSLARGVHLATQLEGWTLARAVSRKALRHGARPGLLEAPKASTLVTTYVGDVGRYLKGCPFWVRGLRGHTPTWGANGFSFREGLVVNLSSFAGLWGPARLAEVAEGLARWARERCGLAGEVLR
jgi:hypothetical protein